VCQYHCRPGAGALEGDAQPVDLEVHAVDPRFRRTFMPAIRHPWVALWTSAIPSHTCRTSWPQVVDQIGHSQVALAMNVYLARKVADPGAVDDLERFLG
jgi:hypothetical protein